MEGGEGGREGGKGKREGWLRMVFENSPLE